MPAPTPARKQPLSPREAGRRQAEQAPPLGPEQIRAAARILATVRDDKDHGTRADHDAA